MVLDGHNKELLANGQRFWCPNGHGQHYSDSVEDKLKQATERIESLRKIVATKNQTIDRKERQINSYRGHAKRRRKLQRAAREA